MSEPELVCWVLVRPEEICCAKLSDDDDFLLLELEIEILEAKPVGGDCEAEGIECREEAGEFGRVFVWSTPLSSGQPELLLPDDL